MLTLSKLLVPHDFGEVSERALDLALEVAARFGAKVYVLHAFENPRLGFPDGALMKTETSTERVSHGAQAKLDELVTAHAGRGVSLEGILRNGDPVECVHEVAKEIGADLIVLGTHGRRGLSRALLGSVAEQIIRTAVVPVMTLHG